MDKIISYLKQKYGKLGKLPKVVQMYAQNPEKGWLIEAMEWKRVVVNKYSKVSNPSEAEIDRIITMAINQKL